MMFAMRLPLAALLVCASMSARLASGAVSGGFFISSTEITKVVAAEQVSSDQVYVRTWQVRANAKANATTVEVLRMMPETLVFVSYAEDTSGSSDVLADVKISGKGFSRVNNILVQNDLRGMGTSMIVQTDVTQPLIINEMGPMLIEVVLRKKRALKRVEATMEGDVVIEDNVLFTTTKEAVAAFPVPTPTSGVTLKVEKSKVAGDWDVKAAGANVSNMSAMTLGLDSLFTGGPTNVTLYCSLSSYDVKAGRIASVSTEFYSGEDKLSGPKSEVSVTRANDVDTLAVQLDASSTMSKVDGLRVTLRTLPSVQVQLPNLAPSVKVSDVCTSTPDKDAGVMLDFRSLIGSAYVVDKDAVLFATEAFFQAPMGTLQIEVKELTTTALAFRSSTRDSRIHYFSTGATTSPQIAIAPNGGKVCLSSSNDLKVAFADPRASPLMSYPGRAGGNTFECKKREIPKRVPSYSSGWPSAEKNETAPKTTATSSSVRVVATSVAHAMVLAIGLIVATVA